jgi:SH3-like domain-containing protein
MTLPAFHKDHQNWVSPMRKVTLTLLTLGVVFTQSALAERLAITATIANIRSGPGSTFDIIWNVQQYYPFEVIKKEGAWYQFRDFEGDTGWVHDSLTDNIQAVITSKPQCNVRKGPGTENEILFSVGSGVPFKVLERKGNWIHILHADGDQGWIHDSLVW